MRIDSYKPINAVYRANQKAKTSATSKAAPKDALFLSETGKDYQHVRVAVTAVSDIREDKVADIRAKMEAGIYHVDEDSFAEKLLARMTQWNTSANAE